MSLRLLRWPVYAQPYLNTNNNNTGLCMAINRNFAIEQACSFVYHRQASF
jgi:hypothetical protein